MHLLSPGLFDYSHMQYDLQRSEDKAGEPSLAEMTEKAIRILKRQPKGFFLLVEGIISFITDFIVFNNTVFIFKYSVNGY